MSSAYAKATADKPRYAKAPAGKPGYAKAPARRRRRHDVHVVTDPKRDQWKVKQGRRTLSTHRKQSTAARAGKREARRDRVELITHGRDGRIRSKDSYGNEGRGRDMEH